MRIFSLLIVVLAFAGCYSFRGVSIAPDINTYYVRQVTTGENIYSDAAPPPDLPERLMEQLRLTVRSQSKLRENDVTPDIEFDCRINSYRITNEASQSGNEVSLNKLTIGISVEYINNLREDEGWKKSYSIGVPFDPSLDLQSVQDDFIQDIFEQITDQVFNDAFTDW